MENILIPMIDFVLEQRKNRNQTVPECLNSIFGYADFLKQPLKLEMFVPCDEYGNVLESPYLEGVFHSHSKLPVKLSRVTDKDVEKYEKAKEKVLFDVNFRLIRNRTHYFIIEDSNGVYLRTLKFKTLNTIESVLRFSVEVKLTQSAMKNIYGK